MRLRRLYGCTNAVNDIINYVSATLTYKFKSFEDKFFSSEHCYMNGNDCAKAYFARSDATFSFYLIKRLLQSIFKILIDP